MFLSRFATGWRFQVSPVTIMDTNSLDQGLWSMIKGYSVLSIHDDPVDVEWQVLIERVFA